MCDAHEHHLIDVHQEDEKELKKTRGTSLPKHKGCDSCQRFGEHIITAIATHEHYKEDARKDIDPNEIRSVDLQKVMLLPRLPGLKKAIFCKRLVTFNESFVPVGHKHGKGIGVLWHKGIAGRSASEVASTFINIVRSSRLRDFKHVTFWADNCSGQNKNWYLFSALVNEVNRPDGNAESITVIFFEPGHMFMSAGSFHSMVERYQEKEETTRLPRFG